MEYWATALRCIEYKRAAIEDITGVRDPLFQLLRQSFDELPRTTTICERDGELSEDTDVSNNPSGRYETIKYPSLSANPEDSRIPISEVTRRVQNGEVILGKDDPSSEIQYVSDTQYIERMEFAVKLLSEGRDKYRAGCIADAGILFSQGIHLVSGFTSLDHQKARSLQSIYMSFIKNKAIVCMKTGEIHDALKSCMTYTRLHGFDSQIAYYIGSLHGKLGNFDQAIAAFEGIKSHPTSTEDHLKLAEISVNRITREKAEVQKSLHKIYTLQQPLYEDKRTQTYTAPHSPREDAYESTEPGTHDTKKLSRRITYTNEELYEAIDPKEVILALKSLLRSIFSCRLQIYRLQSRDYNEKQLLERVRAYLPDIYAPIVAKFPKAFGTAMDFQRQKRFFDTVVLYYYHHEFIDENMRIAVKTLSSSIRTIITGSG